MASGPSQENLKIAQQMAQLMTQMAAQSDRITRSYQTQAQATAQMAENMAGMESGEVVAQLQQVNVTLKEVVAALQNLNSTSVATFNAIAKGAAGAASATEQLADAASEIGDGLQNIETTALQDLQEQLGRAGKNALSFRQKINAVGDYLEGEFPVAMGAATGALSGLQQGFSNLMSIGSGFLGIAGSLVSGLLSVGQAILSMPFKMLEGLTSMAEEMEEESGGGGGGINAYAEALNELKKEFGALNGPVTTAIQNTANLFKGAEGLASAFGDAADRLQLMTKTMAAGGIALQSLAQEFNENGGAIMVFQKGLGFSDEQLGDLAKTAKSTGTSMSKHLLDITKHATHMGKEFGIDFKILTKGMAKANSDMAHFGSVSQKQIGVAVTYFAKLGVELDKVTGAMDAFSTFDDAADKVSTLNQVFGTNIDAMKLVNAEDPSETIEHLRKEFAKAGIDGEKLSRSQRSLIKSMTNLDDTEQKLLFSSKNRGVSLDKIRKEGDKAEKKTMTQADAMSQLAGAIDRVNKSAGGGGAGGEKKTKGGFFGSFFEGITDGLTHTKEFQVLLKNIKDSLRAVYDAGVRLGAAFVEYFPGVKDFLSALGEIFEPGKFSAFANDIVDELVQFMKDLGEPGGKASFSDLMDKLKQKFFDFFDTNSGAGTKLVESFGKIMDAIKVVLAGAIKWSMETLGNFIKDIVKFIADPKSVQGASELGDAAMDYVSPIAQAFKDGWKVLGPALKDLVSMLMDMLMDLLLEFASNNYGKIALILFGPAFAQALLGAATASIAGALSSAISKAFTGPGVQDKILSQVTNLNKTLSQAPAATGATPSLAPAADMASPAKQISDVGDGIKWSTVGKFLAGIAGVIAIGMIAFFVSIALIRAFDITTEEIMKAGLLVMGSALAAVMAAGAIALISKLPEPDKTLAIKLGLIGVAMVAIAVLGGAVAWGVKEIGITLEHVVTALALILGTTIVMIVVAASLVAFAAAAKALTPPIALAIGLGLIAIGVVTLAIAALGAKIVLGVKAAGITEGDVKVASNLISMTAKAIGIAVLAMVAALGATVFAGISKVSKLLGGGDPFKNLEDIVIKVTDVGLAIVKALAGVPRDIGPVVDAFVKILDSVATIMKIIPDTLKAMDFGFFETAEDKTKRINAVNKMIANLIGRSTGDEKIGVVGMITTILDALSTMDTSQIEAAKAIAPLLQGAAAMMSAIGSGISSIGEIAKAIDDDDFEKLPPIINAMTRLVESMSKPIKTLLDGIKPMFDAAAAMPENSAAGVQALASMFQALGPIMQALSLPPGLMDVLKTATSTALGENAGDILEKMGTYMNKVSSSLSTYVLPAMSNAVAQLIQSLKGGGSIDPAQAEVLKAVGPIVTAMLNFAQSMSDGVTKAKDGADALKKSDAIESVMRNMGKHLPVIFKALTDNIKGVIDGVIKVVSGIKVDPSTKSKVEYLSLIFSVVETLIKVAGGIRDPHQWENNLSASDGIVSGIARVAIFLGRLIGPGNAAFGTSKAPLEELLENTEKIVKTIGGKAAGLIKGADELNKLMKSIETVMIAFKTMGEITEGKTKDSSAYEGTIKSVIRSSTTMFQSFTNADGIAMLESIDVAQDNLKRTKIDSATMMKVAGAFGAMVLPVESFKTWFNAINPIIRDSYGPQIQAMRKMIDAIAEIDGILSQTQNIDIKTSLTKFASNFGVALGQKGQFAVQAKEVVINVSFAVAIDATKIEGAILQGDSKIKEKINVLLGAFAGQPEDTAKWKEAQPNTAYGMARKGVGSGVTL